MTSKQLMKQANTRNQARRILKKAQGEYIPRPGSGASGNLAASLYNLVSNINGSFKRREVDPKVITILGALAGGFWGSRPDKRWSVLEKEDGTKENVVQQKQISDRVVNAIAGALLGGTGGYALSRGYYKG